MGGWAEVLPLLISRITWTPKVCRIIAFYGLWAIILRTFEGLGTTFFIVVTIILIVIAVIVTIVITIRILIIRVITLILGDCNPELQKTQNLLVFSVGTEAMTAHGRPLTQNPEVYHCTITKL